ncbi:hypothetical protein GGF31_007679 [Allomyces arbusculus]|nr:hypothetical protein GGF31_007679 [Allomyces arbusculus]
MPPMHPYSSKAAPGAPAAPTTGALPTAAAAAAAHYPLALPPHLAHHYSLASGAPPSDRASSALPPLSQQSQPNASHAPALPFPARWYDPRFAAAQYAAQYAALHAPPPPAPASTSAAAAAAAAVTAARDASARVPASAYELRGSCEAVPAVRVAEPRATSLPAATAVFRSCHGRDTVSASAYQLSGNQTALVARVSESRQTVLPASAYELRGSAAAAAPPLLTSSTTLAPASPASTYFSPYPTSPASASLHRRTTSIVPPPHVPDTITAPVMTVEARLPPRRGPGRPRKHPAAPPSVPVDPEVPAPPRRGPGRPRVHPAAPMAPMEPAAPAPPRRGRGRPRKYSPAALMSARTDSGVVLGATPPPVPGQGATAAAVITLVTAAAPDVATTASVVPDPIVPPAPAHELDHEPHAVSAAVLPAPAPAPRVTALAALDAAHFLNPPPAHVGSLIPPPLVPTPASTTAAADVLSPPTAYTSRRGRQPRPPPDPHALPKKPTRPRTAYMYYCQAERARVTAVLERDMSSVPQRLVFAAVTRALGEAYRELGFVERHPYEMQAQADKRRYMAEMEGWLEEVRMRRGEEGVRETTAKPPPKTRKRRETGEGSAAGSVGVMVTASAHAAVLTMPEEARPPAQVPPPLPPLRRAYDEIESETDESDDSDESEDESEREEEADEETPPPPPPVKCGRGRPRKNPPTMTKAGPPVTRRPRKKRRLSAYNVYFSTVRPGMRESLPHAPAKEIHRMIGLKWKQLPNAERKRFEELAIERHEAAMRAAAGNDDEDNDGTGLYGSPTREGHVVAPMPAAWPESLIPITNIPPILNQRAGSHLKLAVYPSSVGPGTDTGLRAMTGRGYNKRQTINVPPVYKRATRANSLLGSGLHHAAMTHGTTSVPISAAMCAAPHPAAWAYTHNDRGAELPTPLNAGKKGVLTPWVPVGCPPVLHGVPVWQTPMLAAERAGAEWDTGAGLDSTALTHLPAAGITHPPAFGIVMDQDDVEYVYPDDFGFGTPLALGEATIGMSASPITPRSAPAS